MRHLLKPHFAYVRGHQHKHRCAGIAAGASREQAGRSACFPKLIEHLLHDYEHSCIDAGRDASVVSMQLKCHAFILVILKSG